MYIQVCACAVHVHVCVCVECMHVYGLSCVYVKADANAGCRPLSPQLYFLMLNLSLNLELAVMQD